MSDIMYTKTVKVKFANCKKKFRRYIDDESNPGCNESNYKFENFYLKFYLELQIKTESTEFKV